MENGEYYMVTDACWARAAIGKHDGMLCIGCLEARLGKKLNWRNFTDCPLNWRNALIPGYGSARLQDRLLSSAASRWVKGAQEALFAKDVISYFESKTLMSFVGDEEGGYFVSNAY
jgi:hypothetical protein